MNTPIALVLTLLVALTGCAATNSRVTSDAPTTGFLARTLSLGNHEFRYVVYVPRDWTPTRAWPAILFLHGKGECGSDGWRELHAGLGQAILNAPQDWPFVVIFPQKPSEDLEWENYDDAVMAICEHECASWNVDRDRLHLTGLSQGGHGSWTLGAKHAGMWASVVPICAYPMSPSGGWPSFDPKTSWSDPKRTSAIDAIARALRETPVRIFHGADDPGVPPSLSSECFDALRKVGGKVALTIYPGLQHNVWDRAYGEEKLGEWMLAQKRPTPKR